MKNHLWIIITIVVAFGSFMLGYSLPPFLEVGFGGGEGIESGTAADENQLIKQYQQMLDTSGK